MVVLSIILYRNANAPFSTPDLQGDGSNTVS